MFKSSLCRVLSVVCVLLHCSALDVDKQQNGPQTKRQCLRNCFYQTTAQMNGTQLKSKVLQISSRQSCYEKCLQKLGKHGILGNQQTKPLFKRIKRDALISQANSSQYDESNDLCHNYMDYVNYRGLLAKKNYTVKFYNNTGRLYANISWSPPPETENWTGYMVFYANDDWQIKCKDVKKNVTSIYVSHDWGRKGRFQILSLPPVKIDEGEGYKAFYAKPATTDNQVQQLLLTHVNLKDQPSATISPYPRGQPSTRTSPYPRQPSATTSPYSLYSTKRANKTEQTNPPSNPVSRTLSASKTAIVVIFIAVAVVAVAVVVSYFRRSSGKKRIDNEVLMKVKWQFDAFIIYSSEDEKWVNNTLLPTLEEKHGFKCCIHYRDFIAGKPFRQNMVDSVYNSRKTVAVVSRSFLKSTHCNNEMDMALGRLLERRDDSVVVIKLDDVDRKKLPKALKQRSYIDYPKSTEKETWEKQLVDCLKTAIKHAAGDNFV